MAYRLQILVEGEPLDLREEEADSFYVTKQVFDWSDLNTRNGDFTKVFELPITPTNLRLLGDQLPIKNRYNLDQRSYPIPCSVLGDGLPVITDAYLLVGSQSDSEINMTVYGGLGKFFGLLSDADISELGWNEYDITWSLGGVGSITDATEGIVYAMSLWYDNNSQRVYEAIDGGFSSQALTYLEDIELAESGFFVFCKTVLQKIFDQMSLTVDTSLMDDRYNRLTFAVPCDVKHEALKLGELQGQQGRAEQNSTTSIPTGLQVKLTWPDVPVIPNSPLFWNDPNNSFDVIDSSTFVYITVGVTMRMRRIGECYMLLLKDGIEVARKTGPVSGNTEQDFSFYIPFSEYAEVGSQYTVIMYGNPSSGGAVFSQLGGQSDFKITQIGYQNDLNTNISNRLPDISQKDFVREIFKLFCIVPTERDDVVTLNYMHSITDKKVESPSLVLDQSHEIRALAGLGSYARTNQFKYTDTELERLDYNTVVMSDAQVLAIEKTVIESIFSATDVAYFQQATFLQACVIPNYTLEFETYSDNKLKVQSGQTGYETTNPNTFKVGDYISIIQGGVTNRRRIEQLDPDNPSYEGIVDEPWTFNQDPSDFKWWRYTKQTVSALHLADVANIVVGGDWNIRDGHDTLTIPEATPKAYATFIDGLRWENLVSVYYEPVTPFIEKPFVIQAWINLPTTNFISLDFIRPVYIDQYKGYFYINKIEQWKLSGKARITLVELNEI